MPLENDNAVPFREALLKTDFAPGVTPLWSYHVGENPTGNSLSGQPTHGRVDRWISQGNSSVGANSQAFGGASFGGASFGGYGFPSAQLPDNHDDMVADSYLKQLYSAQERSAKAMSATDPRGASLAYADLYGMKDGFSKLAASGMFTNREAAFALGAVGTAFGNYSNIESSAMHLRRISDGRGVGMADAAREVEGYRKSFASVYNARMGVAQNMHSPYDQGIVSDFNELMSAMDQVQNQYNWLFSRGTYEAAFKRAAEISAELNRFGTNAGKIGADKVIRTALQQIGAFDDPDGENPLTKMLQDIESDRANLTLFSTAGFTPSDVIGMEQPRASAESVMADSLNFGLSRKIADTLGKFRLRGIETGTQSPEDLAANTELISDVARELGKTSGKYKVGVDTFSEVAAKLIGSLSQGEFTNIADAAYAVAEGLDGAQKKALVDWADGMVTASLKTKHEGAELADLRKRFGTGFLDGAGYQPPRGSGSNGPGPDSGLAGQINSGFASVVAAIDRLANTFPQLNEKGTFDRVLELSSRICGELAAQDGNVLAIGPERIVRAALSRFGGIPGVSEADGEINDMLRFSKVNRNLFTMFPTDQEAPPRDTLTNAANPDEKGVPGDAGLLSGVRDILSRARVANLNAGRSPNDFGSDLQRLASDVTDAFYNYSTSVSGLDRATLDMVSERVLESLSKGQAVSLAQAVTDVAQYLASPGYASEAKASGAPDGVAQAVALAKWFRGTYIDSADGRRDLKMKTDAFVANAAQLLGIGVNDPRMAPIANKIQRALRRAFLDQRTITNSQTNPAEDLRVRAMDENALGVPSIGVARNGVTVLSAPDTPFWRDNQNLWKEFQQIFNSVYSSQLLKAQQMKQAKSEDGEMPRVGQ